jgi:uncharacterized membrane protein YuzA (DUF378 family)
MNPRRLYIISTLIVLLGSLSWLLLGIFPNLSNSIFYNHNNIVNRGLYILVGIAAIFILYLNVYLFLPFLGETVLPENILQPSIPENATIEVTVKVPKMYEKSKYVVYWASNPGEEIFTFPEEAYEETKNVGVAPITSDSVKLSLQCPQIYKVMGYTLPRHVHYRFASVRNIMSPVFTEEINC